MSMRCGRRKADGNWPFIAVCVNRRQTGARGGKGRLYIGICGSQRSLFIAA